MNGFLAPAPDNQFNNAAARFRRLMRWVALVALVAAVAAVLYVSWGGPIRIHMVIATVAGVFFTVGLAGGLMALAFFSNNSGHDRDARGRDRP